MVSWKVFLSETTISYVVPYLQMAAELAAGLQGRSFWPSFIDQEKKFSADFSLAL